MVPNGHSECLVLENQLRKGCEKIVLYHVAISIQTRREVLDSNHLVKTEISHTGAFWSLKTQPLCEKEDCTTSPVS